MDFSFKLEGEFGKRTAYRERVRGLMVVLQRNGRAFIVHDVSASGLAVVDPQQELEIGRAGLVSLVISDKTLIADLSVSVVRRTAAGLVGLAFGELTPRQEAWLDKLVLEIQKRRINLRKAQKAAENSEEQKTDRADEQT